MRGNKQYNYTKQSRYQRDIMSSSSLKYNPVITSPGHLINRNIFDIGERLIDFLPKISEHFSVTGARALPDASARLFHYAITDENKFCIITLLMHDIPYEQKLRYKKYLIEELNPSLIDISINLMTLTWERGTTNLLGIAEIICYLGAPQMCDKEQ